MALRLRSACAFAMMPVAAISQVAGPIVDWGQPPGDDTVLIPTEFHGVWDANQKACEAAASDMRSYIGANRMRFTDSVGVVQRIIQRGDRSLTMIVSFRSDGDPWEGEVELALSPSGNELTVRFPEYSLTRYRCSEKTGGR